MPTKYDQDSTPGVKLLRLFRKLLADGRRHYQSNLAAEFQCSPQTIMRLTAEIESVIGANLETGLDCRRRWYRIVSTHPNQLNLDYEELRYLSICRDLATPALPETVRHRVDETILQLSLHLAEQRLGEQTNLGAQRFAFYSKGRIDYTPHLATLEQLHSAIRKRAVCRLRYKSLGSATSREHLFAPGRFISMNLTIYVLGALLAEDGAAVQHYTHLAVHRIQKICRTDYIFTGGFPDCKQQTFGLPWHEPREFHVCFRAGKAADYVRERIWADRQKIESQPDGSVILHITTCSEPELMAWVRSFGDEACLLAMEQCPEDM